MSIPTHIPPIQKIHNVKTDRYKYWDVVCGKKTFEWRKNDRDYKVGDYINLMRYEGDEYESPYSGRICCLITYIQYGGEHGIPEDYCIMQIAKLGVLEE